jgi:uncharacterized protein
MDNSPSATVKSISLIVIGLSIGFMLLAVGRWGIVYTHSLGLDAHAKGDYALARSTWRISASLGYTPSKAILGSLYLTNKGGDPDAKLANKYLQDASEDGYVDAQSLYGMALYAGATLPLDRQRGLYWLRKAAAEGDPKARNFLTLIGDK